MRRELIPLVVVVAWTFGWGACVVAAQEAKPITIAVEGGTQFDEPATIYVRLMIPKEPQNREVCVMMEESLGARRRSCFMHVGTEAPAVVSWGPYREVGAGFWRAQAQLMKIVTHDNGGFTRRYYLSNVVNFNVRQR